MRPSDFVDYYEILGIQVSASPDDVQEAWRRCARLYHPDLNPRKTSFRFQRAKEAYEVLKNPVRRRQYDREYRLRSAILSRAAGPRRRTGGFMGTPPGARTPPGPRPTPGTASGAGAGPRNPSAARTPPRSSPPTGGATRTPGPCFHGTGDFERLSARRATRRGHTAAGSTRGAGARRAAHARSGRRPHSHYVSSRYNRARGKGRPHGRCPPGRYHPGGREPGHHSP
ncbi:MAG: J domain-containing protein [Chloroflexi bacterium]|nr:J domain-containing protein [Chloroflexota bacterium]